MRNSTILGLALGAVVGAYMVADNSKLESAIQDSKKKMNKDMSKFQKMFK